MRARAVVAMVGLIALAGCVPAAPAEEPRAEPDPVLLAVGELLDDEGALPLDVAQAIAAATVVDLPGVEPLAVAGEAPHEFAGAAVRRLQAPDAPRELADAVAAALEPAADEEEVDIPPGARARGDGELGIEPEEVPDREELAELVTDVVAELSELSGHDLGIPVRARIVAGDSIRALGIASGVYGGDDTPDACRIALARGLFGLDAASIASTIAHEVWHCFQLDANPAAFESGPLWLIEGQAEWVGETVAGGSPSSAGSWDTWLLATHVALTARSYDAIGVYAVADAVGGDAGTALLPMLGRGAPAALETLFGTAPVEAARATAMALVRDPGFGAPWESTGPGITASRAEVVLEVADGDETEARVDVGRFGTLPVRLASTASEVLRVGVEGDVGAVAMPGAGTVLLAGGASALFCVGPECACPETSPGAGTELPRAESGEGVAAVASGGAAGEVAVVAAALTLEEACDRPALVGQWQTDVANVMSALGSVYGSMPPCTGPWVATFAEDGTWSAGYEATCTVGDTTGLGRARFTGRYVDAGTSFTVSEVEGTGSMQLGDVELPLPGVEGFRSALGGTSDYSIAGDVLTYVVVTPDGARVPISLTRVG